AKSGDKDRVIAALEDGHLGFLAGDFQSARDAFVYAEQETQKIDDRALISASETGRNIFSNFTNLAELEYDAKCSDRIMLHIFKALSYLGMGKADAYNTEIFPLHQTMQDIEQKYYKMFEKEREEVKNGLDNNKEMNVRVTEMLSVTPDINELSPNTAVKNFLNPLALLMAGVARAEANDWENAKVDFNNLYNAMPNCVLAGQLKREVLKRENKPIPPEMAALPELAFDPSGGNVLVIFANGRSAALEQFTINHDLLHTAIPKPRLFTELNAQSLNLSSDGKAFSTEMISDMDAIALWEYRLGYNEMLTRTVISTAIKEGVSIGATAVTYNTVQNNTNNRAVSTLAGVGAFAATNIYKEKQNVADTRSWETLPSQFQAALFRIPSDRNVKLSMDNVTWSDAVIPQDAKSAIIYVHSVGNGKLTFMVFPK
ncbi:MAG: hypothetical protein IJS15_08730, partial [Victivallales bacterium]|nr:hypothetical protein [Victivallales bacterium]